MQAVAEQNALRRAAETDFCLRCRASGRQSAGAGVARRDLEHKVLETICFRKKTIPVLLLPLVNFDELWLRRNDLWRHSLHMKPIWRIDANQFVSADDEVLLRCFI